MVLVTTFPAHAEFPLSSYNDVKDYKAFKDYVTGVGRGIFWANVVMGAQGRPKIFCIPEKLALDDGLVLSLLDQEIRSPSPGSDYKSDTPIELILTNGFAKRFPCD